MLSHIDIWKFAAGLGMFLFGMYQLEEALKSLAGRPFKLFLKRNTDNRFKAILSGTLATAILQSSSVVSLITLAFVGAGIIHMKNALGVILGSNLGTTFTGWIVALIGFKFNIETFAFPLIGLGGILLVLFTRLDKLALIGQLLIGFGFLFLGLDYMKFSIEYLAQNFDLSAFSGYSLIFFLLIGFVFTAIVQSSSAAMVVTLSALSSGIIPLTSAAAMVIGSDLGTTLTALIGGLPGVPAKKRLALGHFLFNLITDLIAFLALSWLLFLIKDVVGVQNDLVAIVLFHSTFNLLGILIFLPIINHFANFLENRFQHDNVSVGKYIHKVTSEIPEAAIEALHNETLELIERVIALFNGAFNSKSEVSAFLKKLYNFKNDYNQIKKLEGEMFAFYHILQKEPLEEKVSARLNQLILVINYSLHAAKGLKDIEPNLKEFRNSTKSSLNTIYDYFDQQNGILINEKINQIITDQQQLTNFEDLAALNIAIQSNYDKLLSLVNNDRKYNRRLNDFEISTVLTVNRELYSAYKTLAMAIAYFLLGPEKAREFESLPAYL